MADGNIIRTDILSYDINSFVLPKSARTLVVVEGFAVNGGRETYKKQYASDDEKNSVRVTVWHRNSDDGKFTAIVQSAGVMGYAGMSNHRTVNSGLTPIGLFKMHTPFGRKAALEGFPSSYVQIDLSAKNQFWSDITNRLETNSNVNRQDGEKLWKDGFSQIYDYAIDSGFDKDNVNHDGTALFLHCTKEGKPSTAGCIAIDTKAMIEIEKLYALGDTYIAQAPESQFEGVYNSYNATGKSAPGEYSNSSKQMPKTETVIIGH